MTTTLAPERRAADAQQAARDRITQAIAKERAARIAKTLAKPTPPPPPPPTREQPPQKPKSGVIDWFLASDRVVGHGHASLPDTINRGARAILSGSGLDPDAPFGGLASKSESIPVVADQAARDAQFPTPSADQRVERQDIGYQERYTSGGWMPEGITRAAGPVIGTAAKGAKRDDTVDDSGVLTAIGALITTVGIGEIDVGTHLIGTSVTVPGVWRPLQGGILHVPNGVNLHFTGPAPRGIAFKWLQVDVGGSVTFDDSEGADPQWFGLTGTGVVGDEKFFNQLTAAVANFSAPNRLPGRGTSKARLADTWVIADKSSQLYDSGVNPKNSNVGESPLLEWAGALGGTVVRFDHSRYCKLAGFMVHTNGADVGCETDGYAPGHIGTQCTFERIFVYNDTPNTPNFVAFRVNHSGGVNQEYHRFIDVAAFGGNNGQTPPFGTGINLSQGRCATTNGSTTITFDDAWLDLGYWVAGISNREIWIKGVGPSGADLAAHVTYLNATQGTLDVAASASLVAALMAFNRNSANGDALMGIDVVAGSTTATLNPRYVAFGFWGSGIAGRRAQIANADADISVAAFLPNATTIRTAVKTGANWKVNQWAGLVVNVSSGTHAGQQRTIRSNTSDTLTWGSDFALDGTDNLQILTPKLLDTTITYLNATQGTLAVAPKVSVAGSYFQIGEMVGRGIQLGTNYNTKGITSFRADLFYFAVGIEVTGGSYHSDTDNWNQNELCFAVGGAISEPVTIVRGNAETNRAGIYNNTFVPLFNWGSRWSMDCIQPGGAYFRFGPSATVQVMCGNTIDPLTGGMPKGSKVFDLSQSDGHVVSIGQSMPYKDSELGLDTLSPANIAGSYWLGLGDTAYDFGDGVARNYSIRAFTRNRRPAAPRFALYNEVDGIVSLGCPDIDLSGEYPKLLRPGQTLAVSEHDSGIVREYTRLNDEDQRGVVGGSLGQRIRGFDQGNVRSVIGSGGLPFDLWDMGRTLRCDPTSGTIFLTANPAVFTASKLGWWCEILHDADTDNFVYLQFGSATFNGYPAVSLVGRYARVKIELIEVLAGPIPRFDVTVLNRGVRKNPAGPGALGAQWDPASIAAAGQLRQQFNVSGAFPGMFVECAQSVDLQGLQRTVDIDSNNHISVALYNPTGAAIDLAAHDIRFKVDPLSPA
ncbi:MAG TPA: hypothetical protein VH439_17385 [Gemmatimonadales bacterium]|jgi:hypothetical protein